jgi:hypothetical protein
MKVKELIAELEKMDPELDVITHDQDHGYLLLEPPEVLTLGMYTGDSSFSSFYPLEAKTYVVI